jgi:hypothetical protein
VRSRIPLLLAAGALALGVTVLLIQISPQVRAGPPPPVTVLEPDALRDSGRLLVLGRRSVDGVPLVEPRAAGGLKSPRSLAAAPDGLTLAVSTVEAGRIGPLTLARADGSQLDVQLPGVRGAAFEPGGSWLAAVDLAGALWRVDTLTGAATRLADGPYGPDPSVLPDGRILVVRLSAIDAPLWAAAETVDGAGAVVPVAGGSEPESQLVYGATPLDDGSVAIVRHRVGGGVDLVRVDGAGSETALARLAGAAAVAVSPDGARLAWPAAGTTWLAPADAVTDAVAIGDGAPARFSPDGSLLLVFGSGTVEIFDVAGDHIGSASSAACWIGGGRGCRP